MNQAFLVMDMQSGIVERLGDRSAPLIGSIIFALEAAHRTSVQVIFVRVAFRDGAPEISPRNKSFSALANLHSMSEGGTATQVHPDLVVAPGDVLVTKRRVSAFSGSDLDVVLRAKSIDSLVLCGIATSGVVLSTLRQAADLDFAISVLSDACADADEEVHRVLMEKVFPRQANVITVREWVAQL
ncbi:MAG TPA: isochorismatase family cysteine hydrolase [Acidimicrobiales bacterium]|nr:isochorismatase family cysteine hydrolase [Acidimicrobiales bacterium]